MLEEKCSLVEEVVSECREVERKVCRLMEHECSSVEREQCWLWPAGQDAQYSTGKIVYLLPGPDTFFY